MDMDTNPRLFVKLICGHAEGATAVALEVLKERAEEMEVAVPGSPPQKKYNGVALAAATLELVPTYQRYGFDLTADGSRPQTR